MFQKFIYIIFFFFSFSCTNIPDGFVYINDIDSSIKIDLRYSTLNNFTGKIIDSHLRSIGIKYF